MTKEEEQILKEDREIEWLEEIKINRGIKNNERLTVNIKNSSGTNRI